MHGKARIVALAPGDGVTLVDPAEGLATFKARALETGGALTVLEREIAPGDAAAAHAHADQDEALYVLSGELRLHVGTFTYNAPAGSFFLLPRGTEHRLENAGDRPARVLAVFTPAS